MLKLPLCKASHPSVLLQNYSCMSNSTAAACVQAKMAADELVQAKHIKSWQTQAEMGEERTERMASHLRAELEEKTQELKVNLKTPILNCEVNNVVMHDISLCALYIPLEMMCVECTSAPLTWDGVLQHAAQHHTSTQSQLCPACLVSIISSWGSCSSFGCKTDQCSCFAARAEGRAVSQQGVAAELGEWLLTEGGT